MIRMAFSHSSGSRARTSMESYGPIQKPYPNPPRILVIAYRFPPQGGVGAQRTAKLVKAWSRWQVPVAVLSGHPQSSSFQDFSLLDELRDPFVWASAGDPSPYHLIRQLRHRMTGNGSRQRLNRFLVWFQALAHFTSLPDEEMVWLGPALWKGLSLARRFQPDCIFVSGPPWTPFLVAGMLARIMDRPLIVDYRDPWTASYIRRPLTPLRRVMNPALERWVLKGAAGITAAHLAILDHLRGFLGKEESRRLNRLWVPNGFDPEDFKPPPPISQRRFVLAYTGSFFERRSPQSLLDVLDDLLAGNVLNPESFSLRLVGSVALAGTLCRQGSRVARVLDIKGYVPHTQSLRYLQESTVNLVIEGEFGDGLNRTSPAKFYEALYAGRPILLLCPPGTTTRLAERAGGCWTAHPEDRVNIRQRIVELHQRWKDGLLETSTQRTVLPFYNRFHQAERLLRFLCRLSVSASKSSQSSEWSEWSESS